jgi:Ni/Co efflux regulator RcnB
MKKLLSIIFAAMLAVSMSMATFATAPQSQDTKTDTKKEEKKKAKKDKKAAKEGTAKTEEKK